MNDYYAISNAQQKTGLETFWYIHSPEENISWHDIITSLRLFVNGEKLYPVKKNPVELSNVKQ